MKPEWNGWEEPKQNWSKLPHAFIDALPLIETRAEVLVILYVLRHTWGFQEFEEGKRITLDEFEHGRKRKDGSRIDNGIGMSRNAIKQGIARAIEHGFLIMEEDKQDAGRIKRYYSLKMRGGQKLTPRGSKIDPQGVRN